MFERYTEKARRVIFFARYEASQFGSPYIETKHQKIRALAKEVWADLDESATDWERVEANLAHLEHQVEQLNGVVIEQSRELEQLKKLVQRQGTTLESIELERIKSTSPKPPHY